MLRVADRFEEDAGSTDVIIDSPLPDPVIRPVVPAQTSDRYGAHRSVSISTILLVLLVHAVAIFAMIQMRGHYIRRQEEKLTVVNLTPPPPAEDVPPPPARPEIVAPPPIVQTPLAPPPVMTTPEPSPVTAKVAVAAPLPPAPAPSAPAAPSTVQAGDIAAEMISGKPPRMPIESRRKREHGTVVLELILGVDGRLISASIMTSSGFPRLDNAALDAAKGWRWAPKIRNGQAVQVKGIMPITFNFQA